MNLDWFLDCDSILCTIDKHINENVKLAMFDLDHTLICPKSKNKFAKNKNDWQFMYGTTVIDTINLYIQKGYLIVIISNQAGLNNDNKINEWIEKLNDIIDKININNVNIKTNFFVFASLKHDYNRKPNVNMLTKYFNNINIKKSFYCGDACGRINDFSDTDLKFARNLGVRFYAPEELFLDEHIEIPEIKYPVIDKKVINNIFNVNDNNEIIIMVGMPASGKSYVSKMLNKDHNYKIVNQDELNTIKKCQDAVIKYIKQTKNIVIDATNGTVKTRKKWIELAKEYDYDVRIIHMMTSYELCKHNNEYRGFYNEKKKVPEIVYKIYKKNYEEPNENEGIKQIMKFYPNYPDDPNYYRYYF